MNHPPKPAAPDVVTDDDDDDLMDDEPSSRPEAPRPSAGELLEALERRGAPRRGPTAGAGGDAPRIVESAGAATAAGHTAPRALPARVRTPPRRPPVELSRSIVASQEAWEAALAARAKAPPSALAPTEPAADDGDAPYGVDLAALEDDTPSRDSAPTPRAVLAEPGLRPSQVDTVPPSRPASPPDARRRARRGLAVATGFLVGGLAAVFAWGATHEGEWRERLTAAAKAAGLPPPPGAAALPPATDTAPPAAAPSPGGAGTPTEARELPSQAQEQGQGQEQGRGQGQEQGQGQEPGQADRQGQPPEAAAEPARAIAAEGNSERPRSAGPSSRGSRRHHESSARAKPAPSATREAPAAQENEAGILDPNMEHFF